MVEIRYKHSARLGKMLVKYPEGNDVYISHIKNQIVIWTASGEYIDRVFPTTLEYITLNGVSLPITKPIVL